MTAIMELEKTGISGRVRKEIGELAKLHHISKVVLFGSRARGDFHPKSNLVVLKTAYNENKENEFIISGIIDKFSIQFELGWKVLKELLIYEGTAIGKTGSPREIIKEAYCMFDFMDEAIWLHMLKDRNDTSHIYDGDMAKQLVEKILHEYIPELVNLKKHICNRYQDTLEGLE